MSKSKKITKAIGASAKAAALTDGAAVATTAGTTSNVTANSMSRTLSPTQIYELVPSARRAIDAKAAVLAKAKIRLLSRTTGDEIISGELYNIYKYRESSAAQQIRSYCAWWNIRGEVAIWTPRRAGIKPNFQMVLDPDPSRLMPYPHHARSIEHVQVWNYMDNFELNGSAGVIQIPKDELIFTSNFNPTNPLRGLSPLVSVAQEASTVYFANRYNSSFFQNGAHADIIIKLPKGTTKEQATEYVDNWSARHSIFYNNGFKVSAVVDGDGTDIVEPAQTARDGQFLQLTQHDIEVISGLIGTPAVIMGNYNKTRFDTVAVELESWVENDLIPLATLWSELQQSQFVDRWYRHSSIGTERQKFKATGFTKALRDKQFDENPESNVIVLLDPDNIPLVSRVNRQRYAAVAELRESADLSVAEAAAEVGLELPERPERDDIWVPNGRQNISKKPETPETDKSELADLQEQVKSLQKQLDEKEPVPNTPAAKALGQLLRKYRAEILESAAAGSLYSKDTFKAFSDYPKMTVQLHKDFVRISTFVKSENSVELIKSYLNETYKNSRVRDLAV